MLIDELQDAMRRAAEAQPFVPSMEGIPRRSRQIRQRKLIAAVLSVSTLVAISGGLAAVIGTGGPGAPDRLTQGNDRPDIAAVLAEVNGWGPTRGDLATSRTFLSRVRAQWAHPSGDYYGNPANIGATVETIDGNTVRTPPDRSRHLTGVLHILYAGDTPDGPAAVVAQRSSDANDGVYLGFMLPIGGRLRLVASYTPSQFPAGGSRTLDPHVITFKTSGAGDHLVVLPAQRQAQISISLRHTLNSAGHVTRAWRRLAVRRGVATASAGGALGFWDSLVQVRNGGQLVDETPVTDVLAGTDYSDRPAPTPDNLVTLPLQDQEIGGSTSGVGLPPDLNDAWLARFGKVDQPYLSAPSWISGTTRDGDGIVVEQVWLPGDPAHTVVLQVVGRSVDVLSDTISDPSLRPLVFLRLPDHQQWLVVGGEHATITGYRPVGAPTWSDVDTFTPSTRDGRPITTRANAFIQSSAARIQIRLRVDGEAQIVSSTSSRG